MIKNLRATLEILVQSLGQEDPLQKGMATHFSFLAWRIPWTEEPAGLPSPWGGKEQTRLSNYSDFFHGVKSPHASRTKNV